LRAQRGNLVAIQGRYSGPTLFTFALYSYEIASSYLLAMTKGE